MKSGAPIFSLLLFISLSPYLSASAFSSGAINIHNQNIHFIAGSSFLSKLISHLNTWQITIHCHIGKEKRQDTVCFLSHHTQYSTIALLKYITPTDTYPISPSTYIHISEP